MKAASSAQVHILVMAARMYAEDYGALPETTDSDRVRRVLSPWYLKDESDYYSRRTGRPHGWNPHLSRKKLSQIADPGRLVACYEAEPAPDGKRVVAFLNGTERRVAEAEWRRLKSESGIP